MLSLGAFAFAAPGMLALLLALPVIYWLLRMIPPLPRLVGFPAPRPLLGARPPAPPSGAPPPAPGLRGGRARPDQRRRKIRWWLLLLPLLPAPALTLAVAKP